MFAPVRLGFPRETLKGATYNGQKIPEGMVRYDPLMLINIPSSFF